MSTARYGLPRNKKGECRWCQGPLPKFKRSWCSVECRHLGWLVISPDYARQEVFKRDQGVCATCGADAEQVKRVVYSLHGYDDDSKNARFFFNQLWGGTAWATHYWEMDHIKPVVEGGGRCGLDNLRTLCRPCHKAETAALAARRARARRLKKLPLFSGPLGQIGEGAG